MQTPKIGSKIKIDPDVEESELTVYRVTERNVNPDGSTNGIMTTNWGTFGWVSKGDKTFYITLSDSEDEFHDTYEEFENFLKEKNQ